MRVHETSGQDVTCARGHCHPSAEAHAGGVKIDVSFFACISS